MPTHTRAHCQASNPRGFSRSVMARAWMQSTACAERQSTQVHAGFKHACFEYSLRDERSDPQGERVFIKRSDWVVREGRASIATAECMPTRATNESFGVSLIGQVQVHVRSATQSVSQMNVNNARYRTQSDKTRYTLIVRPCSRGTGHKREMRGLDIRYDLHRHLGVVKYPGETFRGAIADTSIRRDHYEYDTWL